jgi:hypothetical protein
MHVNSKISSGALSGMKRLIDEIRSFKCDNAVRVTKLSVTAFGVCNRIVHDRIVCDRDVGGGGRRLSLLGHC